MADGTSNPAAPDARPAYPAWVTTVFWVDLTWNLLYLMALAGIFTNLLVLVSTGRPIDFLEGTPYRTPDRPQVWSAVVVLVGVVACGLPGNLLVLRRRPLGVWLCYGSLAFTALSIVLAAWVSRHSGLERDPADVGLSVALGLIRTVYGIVYLAAVWVAHRQLRATDADSKGMQHE